MAMNNATKAEQEEAAERRRMRKLTAGLRREGGIEGRGSSSDEEDDDDVDERKMPDIPDKVGDESSLDSEQGLNEAFAALESPRDHPELRRRNTQDALSKGIPGFFTVLPGPWDRAEAVAQVQDCCRID